MVESRIGANELSNDLIYIPDELMRFIKRDTYSLLIKGFAGTGKTTLALAILRALESKNNFFYISTRISPKQIFQYYPWLDKFIESSKSSNSSETSAEYANLMSAFEDARLDEPESLFERITNQLMDIKSPIIIIDSWDAIASFMDKEARLNNERVLQTWRERADAKLIFISEHPTDTTLDFLVDGIVELKQSYYDNVKVREIFMIKLRGVRIDRPSYFYTLENGVFRSFAPYKPVKLLPSSKNSPSARTFEGPQSMIKSGYPVLDDAIGGGLPRKGIVLLELNSHITTAVVMAFIGRIISNFISNGNPVLLQPFDWIGPQAIIEYLGPYVSSGKNLFKILWNDKVNGIPESIVLSRQKQQDPSLAAINEIKQKYSDKLLLNIMGTDILQKRYGSDTKCKIENLLYEFRIHADLTMAVIRQSQKDILEYFTEVSDLHLQLLMINGTLFLQSLVPASTLYSLIFDNKDYGYQLGLQPVV